MHIPDGFLSLPVWSAMDGAALPSVAYLARRAQRESNDNRIPLMGVMGAFVFAAQMINFPVANGTSAHLLGGALLSFTLGPAPASIVMTAILATQALVFQDGGLLALGANVFNMAIAGVLAGYLPYAVLRGRVSGIFLGGLSSVIVSGVLALSELRLSDVSIPRPAILISLGIFAVNGLIEGAITLAVMRALKKIEPEFAHVPKGARHRPALVLLLATAALAIAGVFLTSASPDGIQKLVAESGKAAGHIAWFAAPMADYKVRFLNTAWITKILAGLAGVFLVYALCARLGRALRGA